MRVALVYDRVNRIGGAERVLEELHGMFPDAPLYTAVYDPDGAPWAEKFDVRTSFLQQLPLARSHHELYGWLTPVAFEQFDFSEYDLVISVTSADAKGIITRPETLHVCYCLTPTRYLWSDTRAHFSRYRFKFFLTPLVRLAGRILVTPLRVWDQVAAQRPDHYIAISKVVKNRIRAYYGREAQVIYPPVDVKKFRSEGGAGDETRLEASAGSSTADITGADQEDYFLVVARLVPYKRVDIAVEAFNRNKLPLVVVGDGPERRRLERRAAENVRFVGQVSDEELVRRFRGCRALVFPVEEDFGIVAVEAMASGRPVIAFRGGAARETVVEGETGLFFDEQTPESLEAAVAKFMKISYNRAACIKQAEKFDRSVFKRAFDKALGNY